nr:hypothetical protein Iba_chr04dCG7250 [Ipomoea batatas]
MKKLTKSTVLGCKRKASPENKGTNCLSELHITNQRTPGNDNNITPITDDRTWNEVRMDRSNRYKTNKRTPLSDITITPTTNDTIGIFPLHYTFASIYCLLKVFFFF